MNLKIGNLLIKNNVVVGPMAGISDPVFFELIAKFKPGLIFSEMISAVALKHHSKKTNDMLKYKKCKIPLAIQIFGSKTIDLVSAAIYIYNTYHPAMIDINMGCPVHKVAVKSSAGASLLQDPKKVAEIIKAIKKELPTCPLSIKIRSGWDDKNINYLDIIKAACAAGVDAITLHPRTASQGYRGKADWSQIQKAKQISTVPIIGNGDVFSVDDALKLKQQTMCDAIMLARGIIGNPWLIKQVKDTFNFKRIKKTTIHQIKKYCIRHLWKLVRHYGVKKSIGMFRKFLPYYLKGKKDSKKILNQLNQINDYKKIIKYINHNFVN